MEFPASLAHAIAKDIYHVHMNVPTPLALCVGTECRESRTAKSKETR